PAAGDQQGGVLRHQYDPGEIHDETAGHDPAQRAPPAHGAGDAGAGAAAGRRAGARRPDPGGRRMSLRLLRYRAQGGLRWGAATGRGLVDRAHLDPSVSGAIHGFLCGDGRARLAAAAETGDAVAPLDAVDYAPFLPDPKKIFCVVVNYGSRNAEYR